MTGFKFKRKVIFLLFMATMILMIFQVDGYMDANSALAEENQVQEMETRGEIVNFSGDVHVEKNQMIEGDVIAFAGNVTVDGIVQEDVIAFAGDVIINESGSVGGDAISLAGTVTVSSLASFDGSTISLEASRISEILATVGMHTPWLALGSIFGIAFKVLSLLGFLVIAFILTSLAQKQINNMSGYLESNIGRVLIIGFISLVAFPFLVLAVALTIVGIALIPFILFGFFALVFYGYVVLAVLVGRHIFKLFKTSQVIALELLVGYVSLWLIQQLPLISSIIYVAIIIISLGLVLDTKLGTMKPWLKKS